MAGKKGMICFGEEIIDDVLRMRQEGKTHREISEHYGFDDRMVIKRLVERYNRKQREMAAGRVFKKKGGQKKQLPGEENKDEVIKQLQMENTLLRSFLLEMEGWDAKK